MCFIVRLPFGAYVLAGLVALFPSTPSIASLYNAAIVYMPGNLSQSLFLLREGKPAGNNGVEDEPMYGVENYTTNLRAESS